MSMRIVVILLLFLSITVSGEQVRNVAVLDFRANGAEITPENLNALTTRFEAELLATSAFRIVERRDMANILQEQGFQQSGACTESDCQVKVGQLLGVDLILTGLYQKHKDMVSLTVKMVNVETSVVEKSHSIDIDGDMQDMLRAGCAEMALVMAGKKTPEGDRQVLTIKKPSVWPWVIGGVVIVGLGVAVALLLTQDDSGSSDRNTGNTYDN